MRTREQFAIVITHSDADGRLVDMPWIDDDLGFDQSDWVVLSVDGWRLVAAGDPAVWPALERRLRIGSHVSQPDQVLIVGHAGHATGAGAVEVQAAVGRIVRRVRSLHLPSRVRGICTDACGGHRPVSGPEILESTGRGPEVDYEPAA